MDERSAGKSFPAEVNPLLGERSFEKSFSTPLFEDGSFCINVDFRRQAKRRSIYVHRFSLASLDFGKR